MFEYIDNDQIRNYLLELMKNENMTYKQLGEKLNTSPQNAHKMICKNQLKLDDVSKICSALGYNFYFDIYKNNEKEKGLYQTQIDEINLALKRISENAESLNNAFKEMSDVVDLIKPNS